MGGLKFITLNLSGNALAVAFETKEV